MHGVNCRLTCWWPLPLRRCKACKAWEKCLIGKADVLEGLVRAPLLQHRLVFDFPLFSLEFFRLQISLSRKATDFTLFQACLHIRQKNNNKGIKKCLFAGNPGFGIVTQLCHYPSYMVINMWHVATIYQSSGAINHTGEQCNFRTLKPHMGENTQNMRWSAPSELANIKLKLTKGKNVVKNPKKNNLI